MPQRYQRYLGQDSAGGAVDDARLAGGFDVHSLHRVRVVIGWSTVSPVLATAITLAGHLVCRQTTSMFEMWEWRPSSAVRNKHVRRLPTAAIFCCQPTKTADKPAQRRAARTGYFKTCAWAPVTAHEG